MAAARPPSGLGPDVLARQHPVIPLVGDLLVRVVTDRDRPLRGLPSSARPPAPG
jgi:hypothetical protein